MKDSSKSSNRADGEIIEQKIMRKFKKLVGLHDFSDVDRER
jgi:hypothetical protein